MEADNQFATALLESSDHSALDDVRELVIYRHTCSPLPFVTFSGRFVIGHILTLLSLGKEP